MRSEQIDKRAMWCQLAPHRVLPAESQFPYPVLQLVSGQKPGPPGKSTPRFGLVRGFGHAWLRLIDRDGGVISVGFYPDEAFGIHPERLPGLCMPGMLLHPDKYDRVASEQLATSIKLSDAQFLDLVTWLEAMQRQRWTGGLSFSLTHFNCVEFVAQAAAKAGVQVPGHGPLVALCAELSPPPLRVLFRALEWFSPTLRRVVFNLALQYLGGSQVERRLAQPAQAKPADTLFASQLAPLLPQQCKLREIYLPLWHTHWLRGWQKKVGSVVLQT
jgi:hypothetical protein